ncbi:MarR family winged helix-turn-helix transcriptional regulator [Curtobacterium sp. MCBD17_003]|uniref:MarR family winged helix-turn-helix transcriptional regulator n=1 Tax=Curtobacterium sp. MCBD17_003 TaxID=2175667 RepID=UPI0032E7FF2A
MSDTSKAVAAWEALFRAQVTVMRNLNTAFPSSDISFNEYDVCYNLSKQPGRRLRMRDLTGQLLLTQPSISRLVERLAARGVVEKLPDPTDARGVIVALTTHGFDLYRTVAKQHAATIAEQVGAGLDDDELGELEHLCTKLRTAAAAATDGTTAHPALRANPDSSASDLASDTVPSV